MTGPPPAGPPAGAVWVDDPDDPRLAEFLGLRDHVLRQARERDGGDMAGVFMAEGDLVVGRALRAGYRLLKVLVDGTRRQALPPLPADAPVYAAGPQVLVRITGYHLHRGMIACFERRPVPLADEVLAGARRVLVLENVVNPTNLGVIVRSAAGLGMDAALLDPTCCDPLYRRAARVAMGEVYALPYARLAHLPDGLAVVRGHGHTLVGLTPDPTAKPIGELRPGPDERLALVLGTEGTGLSGGTLDACDVRVRIPMHRGVDSLNVGAAAAIACFVVGGAPGHRLDTGAGERLP